MTGGEVDERAAARAERREQLLDDVIEVVRRDGADASMEQLAAGCGITKPILYRHFDGRDGLVEAVAHRFVDDLLTHLLPVLTVELPAVERVRVAVDRYLAVIEREPQLYRFLSTEAAEQGETFATMVAEHAALVIERLLVERDRDPAPARPWAYGLVGMVHLAGDWWVVHRPCARTELVEHLLTILEPGIAALDLDGPTRR